MALETATYISGLVNTNPVANDPKSEGDNHIRLLKATLLNTFPAITGAVTPTHTELNYVDGVTSAIQTQIDAKGAITGQTWTGTHEFPTQAASDNSTKAATTAYVDTADALKANIASPTFTGTPAAPTAATGTSTTQLATTAFVSATAFSAALPSQTGNNGKFVTTDGTNASWGSAVVPGAVTSSGITQGTGKLLGRTTASTGAIEEISVSGATLSGGTLTISTPTGAQGSSLVFLSEVSVPVGTPVATVTFDGTFDSTYELYEIHVLDCKSDTNNARLEIRVKIGGTFQVLNTLYATTTPGTYATDSTNGTIIPDMGNATPTANTASFVARLFKPSEANVGKFIHFLGAQYTSQQVDARLVDGNNAAVTGLRFQGSAGNISGTFRLYGYKKA